MWIRYDDFKKYVIEAYFMEPKDFSSLTDYGKFTFNDARYAGHSYEGQVANGQMNGYGIYSFGSQSYIVGRFENGSREGWFMIIDEGNSELIKMINYQNNVAIDQRSLGFTEDDKNKDVAQIKDYFKVVMPDSKIIFINEEPDMDVATKLD